MSITLTQQEADALFAMEKHYLGTARFDLPLVGGRIEVPLFSSDKREEFLLDISRGRIAISKSTYQNRARTSVVLARIDVGGPVHRNPDDEEIPCPHLHLYREGFGDKWAMALPPEFSSCANMQETFQVFMGYCRVATRPIIESELFA